MKIAWPQSSYNKNVCVKARDNNFNIYVQHHATYRLKTLDTFAGDVV